MESVRCEAFVGIHAVYIFYLLYHLGMNLIRVVNFVARAHVTLITLFVWDFRMSVEIERPMV